MSFEKSAERTQYEFLKKMGFAGSALAAIYITGHLQSSANDRVSKVPKNLTPDLTDAANAGKNDGTS